jgi:hypothetical protein
MHLDVKRNAAGKIVRIMKITLKPTRAREVGKTGSAKQQFSRVVKSGAFDDLLLVNAHQRSQYISWVCISAYILIGYNVIYLVIQTESSVICYYNICLKATLPP